MVYIQTDDDVDHAKTSQPLPCWVFLSLGSLDIQTEKIQTLANMCAGG